MRIAAPLLLLALFAPSLRADPCQLTYQSWFDATVVGFTYNGVKVKKKNQTPNAKDEIVVQVTNNSATREITLSSKEWAAAESGCAIRTLSQDIKNKLGIPNVSVARAPARLAAVDFDFGDLNGDGLLDQVKVAYPTNALIVELRQANETYGPRVNFPTGTNPNSVLLADFNGDSRLDAAVTYFGAFNQSNGGLSLLLGNPDGTFRSAVTYAAGPPVISLATADFNADSRPDLALLRENGTVIILLANADGTLRSGPEFTTATSASSLLAADFTGDNRPDLAVSNIENGNVYLFAATGNGSFANAQITNVGGRPSYLGALDANLDGRWDLITLHRQNATLSLWLAQPSGQLTFANRVLTANDMGAFTIDQFDSDPPLLLAPDAVRTRMLIHAVEDRGRLTGEPAFLVDPNPSQMAIADFNADGRPDVVTNGASARLQLVLSSTNNTLQNPQAITLESRASAVATADFNSDGRPDLAVALASRLAILLGGGNGTFTPGASLPSASNLHYLVAADFNADGRPDLAAIHESNSNVAVYIAEAGGTFRAPVNYPSGAAPNHLAVGDLNRDGRPDLVSVNRGRGSNASLHVFLANADGSFRALPAIEAGREADSVAIADFNSDGRPDLAYSGQFDPTNQFAFRIGILPGNGDGTFGTRTAVATDDFPKRLVAADFDLDGKQDLLVAHCCGSTDLARLLGNGDGTFRREFLPGGADPGQLAVADFDRDGRPDVALLNASYSGASNGVLAIFYNPFPPLLHTSAAANRVQTLAPDSITTAYGQNFAAAAELAPTPDWPTTLGGVSVQIRDTNARTHNARIYFVSPNQVNYQLPPELPEGFAWVSVRNVQGQTQSGLIRITKTAPGVFFAGPNIGAAALLLRAFPDGRQEVESTLIVGTNGDVLPRGLTLGPAPEQEVILLFGTGFRGHNGLGSLSATIGNVPAQVLYAGPQNEYPGLDQINILIPKSLRGRGQVDLRLRVNGVPSNVVRLRFN